MRAGIPANEEARLRRLRSLRVLDTLPEQVYDDIVEAVSTLMDVPVAAITLVDEERQWFKAKIGTDVCETSRDIAVCAHTILQDVPLVVPDTTLDPRFSDNPLVMGESGLRFYAGAPIVVHGDAVGSLCCIDVVPREITERQVRALAALARQVAALLVARLESRRLAETERRFEAFFDNAPAVMFIKDGAGRMRGLNRHFEAAFQRPSKDLLGLTDEEWLPQTLAAQLAATDLAVRESGRALQSEERFPTADGSERIWQSLKFPIEVEGETWLGGFAFDVTRLRESEAKIQEQSEMIAERNVELAKALALAESAADAAQQAAHRFEQLFAGLPVACFTFDREGRILEWNSAAELLWGIPAYTTLMQPLAGTVFPKEEEASIRDVIGRVFSGETIKGQERLVQTRKGTPRWVLSSTIPLRNIGGKVVGAISANLDITKRKTTEELLQEKEERFRTVVESLHEGVIVHDQEEGIVLWNASAERLLGFAGEDLRGLRTVAWDMIRPDGSEFPAAERPVAKSLATGEAQEPTVMGIRLPGGGLRWLNSNVAPLLSRKEGKPRAVVASFLDVTERWEQEQRIGAQMDQIRQYSVELELQKQELQRANSRLRALATTDGLTGVRNHRYFQEFLRRKIAHCEATAMPLSVVLIDVDHFKAYNDEFGHQAGDAVLRAVAQTLQGSVRGQDLVARYGGEEFVIVMPGANAQQAAVNAERIRERLANQDFSCRKVTASFGVASLAASLREAEALVRAADAALYQSKSNGRNRVTVWGGGGWAELKAA